MTNPYIKCSNCPGEYPGGMFSRCPFCNHMTDPRRHPADFLDEIREMRARRDQNDEAPVDTAGADQLHAAGRDAHQFVREVADVVIDVDDIGEREEALMLALAAAADRRGLSSPRGLDGPRPELRDLTSGPTGRCDVCDTSAHRLHDMFAQYGPYVFRARVCVRCRALRPGDAGGRRRVGGLGCP